MSAPLDLEALERAAQGALRDPSGFPRPQWGTVLALIERVRDAERAESLRYCSRCCQLLVFCPACDS